METSIELVVDDYENDSSNLLPYSKRLTLESVNNVGLAKKVESKNDYQLVNNLHLFEECLRQHEVENYSKYTIYKTNGSFSKESREPMRKPRVHWGALSKVCSRMATTPYLLLGTRYYVCHHGKCYYTSKLQKNLKDKNKLQKRYNKMSDTKKVGCPAGFKVQRLIVFPDNKVLTNSASAKATMGVFIRKNIDSIRKEHKFLFKLPDMEEHQRHGNFSQTPEKEPLDKVVIDKIKEIVLLGQTDVALVFELLEEYVENELQIKDKSRRKFHPSKSDVQRIIQLAKSKLRREKIDYVEINEVVNSMDSSEARLIKYNLNDHKILNNPNENSNFGLVFVYQSQSMRVLYRMYGQYGILLDPTYNFCQFPFPFYSLVVQTNVGYQVVGLVMVEYEIKELIEQGLRVILEWNSTIFPKYGVTVVSAEEQKALESVFPAMNIYILPYYCEAEWKRRLILKDCLNVQSLDVLLKFKAVINASSEAELRVVVNEIKSYNGSIFKEYFQKNWQKDMKKYVQLYRPSDYLFESNEALNNLDDVMKYAILSTAKNYSVHQMISYLCKEYFPERLQHYISLNQAILRRASPESQYIPTCLMDCSQWVINIVKERLAIADKSLSKAYVEYLGESFFSISSKSEKRKYNVRFDDINKIVICDCPFFVRRRVICEHPIIVGRFYPQWSLEKISDWLFDKHIYKHNPTSFDNVVMYNDTTLKFEENKLKPESHLQPTSINDSVNEDQSTNLNEDQIMNGASTTGDSTLKVKSDCLQYLVSIETMVHDMQFEDVKDLRLDLEGLTRKWRDKVNVSDASKDNIPPSLMQRISELFVEGNRKKIVKKRCLRKKRRKSLTKKEYLGTMRCQEK